MQGLNQFNLLRRHLLGQLRLGLRLDQLRLGQLRRGSSAGDLERIINSARLPLDGRTHGPRAAVEVARQLRVGREARRILGEVLVESVLEFRLLVALITAKARECQQLGVPCLRVCWSWSWAEL